MPPSLRCAYFCDKEATGPLDRHKLIDHINKQALETPDKPEAQPFVAGTIRGTKARIIKILNMFRIRKNYISIIKLFKINTYTYLFSTEHVLTFYLFHSMLHQ